jgi:hypothetical protein
MEIHETINKWFADTEKKIVSLKASDKIALLCASVTAVVKTYINSILAQLDMGFVLPSVAGLRIVSDLVNKFLWCLNEDNDDKIKDRIKRWEKSTAKENKKLLEGFIKIIDDSQVKSAMQETIAELDHVVANNRIKEMPPATRLFEENKNLFFDNVYPQAYQQFNAGVHIDIDILEKIWTLQNQTGKWVGDIQLSPKDIAGLKKHCLSSVWMVLKMLYRYYYWDVAEIDDEYKNVKRFAG